MSSPSPTPTPTPAATAAGPGGTVQAEQQGGGGSGGGQPGSHLVDAIVQYAGDTAVPAPLPANPATTVTYATINRPCMACHGTGYATGQTPFEALSPSDQSAVLMAGGKPDVRVMAKQAVLGDWSDEKNALGDAAQTATGLTGLDTAADVRDASAAAYEVYQNPRDKGARRRLVLNGVALVIPFATGAMLAKMLGKEAGEAGEATVEAAARNADEVAPAAREVGDAAAGAAPSSRTAEGVATWVDEGGKLRAGGSPGMRPDAYDFQSGTPGARSNPLTGRSQAPYLEFTDEAGNVVGAKFDGVEGLEVIDRKMNSFFSDKAVDEARRQSAVAQFYGLQAVWEFPTQQAVDAASRFMRANNITTIQVRLAR